MKKLNLKTGLFSLMVLAFLSTYAQGDFEFVKDIRTPMGGSTPKYLTEYDGKLYFSAYDDIYGEELWVSDGTGGGTQLLLDINPGNGGSYPNFLTVMNHMLYFTAYDPATGTHLWKTYGTPAGTGAVILGDSCVSPYYLTVYKDRLYFCAFDNTHGNELWVSDGSAGGTRMVKDINTRTDMGNGRTDDGNPSRFVVYNNLLYFAANDGVHGNELWVTDGTEMGTHMVKDINPGNGSSSLIYPTVFGDKMYFRANDGTNGNELWVTNGSENGTQLFKDIWPGVNSADPQDLVVLNNKMFFGAASSTGYGFWVSDGTASGTVMLKQVWLFFFGDDKRHITAFNGRVYFRADDGYYGNELWASDGTPNGTQMLKDIYPGMYGGCQFNFTAVYNNKLYFVGGDNNYSESLWVTDGTTAGTKRIAPTTWQSPMQGTTGFIEFKGSLFFAATYDERNLELWKLTTAPSDTQPVNMASFAVYPNPVRSAINLTQSPQKAHYTIISTNGKVVLTGETGNTDTFTINVTTLEAGTYLLRTENRTIQFIKE
jgi:ELWxxDGT repeat protein